MALVLRGEVDPGQVEALEEEQAEERGEWEARGPARAQGENVCAPVVEPPLPIRRDYPATSGAVPSVIL